MKFWPIYKVAFGSAGNKDPNNTNNIYDVIASKDGADATFTETTWLASFTTNTFDTVVNTNFYTNVTPNGWKGPYFGFGSDPWGTKYYLTASNLTPNGLYSAYVLSAGPDQAINTAFSTARTTGPLTASGDDLILQIR